MKRKAWALFAVLFAPLGFSLSLARLYGPRYFLFFFTPSIDDEGYFDHLNVWFGDHIYSSHPADHCWVVSNWRGIGSAILWSPGYLLFKWLGRPLQDLLGLQALSTDEMRHLGAATMNYFIAAGILGLSLLILKPYVSRGVQWLFAAILLFAGLLPYYLFRRPLMSHGPEAFFFLLTIWAIERRRAAETPIVFLTIGLGLGGLLVTRFQHLPVVGVAVAILALEHRRQLGKMFWILGPLCVSLAAQLAINHLNRGQWFVPPSQIIPGLTSFKLMALGSVQIVRIVRAIAWPDWGLIPMFPWLLFGFFLSREDWKRLGQNGLAWIISPLMSLLVLANYIAHGGSYGQRYLNLWVISLSIIAALGFERIRQNRFRMLGYLGLAITVLISLTHFAAFESDERDLTLRMDQATLEGPVRPEWTANRDNVDWINENYSRNVYRLFRHPATWVQKFGAAPLPLSLSATVLKRFSPTIETQTTIYLEKHQISLPTYWRYALFVAFLLSIVWAILVVGWSFWARKKSLSPGLI